MKRLKINHHLLKFVFTIMLLLIVLINGTSIANASSIKYTDDQFKVLNDINSVRSKMGLPLVELDESLTKAAIDHSIYLFANDIIGHEQNNGLYYTQKEFYERIENYTGSNYYLTKGWYMIAEDVDYRSPTYAIRDLIEAPYHRYPIIHPELTHIGVGTIGYHNTVVTFGMTQSKNYIQSPILYPYNNETNVLLSQKVYEIPDPFDDTPMNQEEAGYVLSIFTGIDVNSDQLNISLYDVQKNPIDFILKSLTPNQASDFWIVIPTEKLKPLTTYTFQVNNSVSKFTTMSEADFENRGIFREDQYQPYSSNKSYFDKLIASVLNPELEHKLNEEEHDLTIINEEIRTKKPLPTKFEQRGYSRDNIGIYLNDNYITLEPTAKIHNNRTFIPLRGVLEKLDANVHYNNSTKDITITQNELTIILKPNTKNVKIMNSNKTINEELDTAPFVENGTAFVPLRFLSFILGADVVWDQSSFTVGISY